MGLIIREGGLYMRQNYTSTYFWKHEIQELSRAHTPRTGTSAIAGTILIIFVCIAQFIDDPYLC